MPLKLSKSRKEEEALINAILEKTDLTISDIAKNAGLSHSTLVRWKNDKSKRLSHNSYLQLNDYLESFFFKMGVSCYEVDGMADTFLSIAEERKPIFIDTYNFEFDAGNTHECVLMPIDYFGDDLDLAGGAEFHFFKARDNSMYPQIEKGDVVFFKLHDWHNNYLPSGLFLYAKRNEVSDLTAILRDSLGVPHPTLQDKMEQASKVIWLREFSPRSIEMDYNDGSCTIKACAHHIEPIKLDSKDVYIYGKVIGVLKKI